MRHGLPLGDLPGPHPASFPDPSSPTHQDLLLTGEWFLFNIEKKHKRKGYSITENLDQESASDQIHTQKPASSRASPLPSYHFNHHCSARRLSNIVASLGSACNFSRLNNRHGEQSGTSTPRGPTRQTRTSEEQSLKAIADLNWNKRTALPLLARTRQAITLRDNILAHHCSVQPRCPGTLQKNYLTAQSLALFQ